MKKLLLGFAASLAICGQALAIPVCDNANANPNFCLTPDVNGVIGVRQFGTLGVPETANSGNVANAVATATLAASATKKTWISGFHIQSTGATAALAVDCTVTGVVNGPLHFTFLHPLVGAYASRDVSFSNPIPASAVNTTIVVSCPASGAGGTNASVDAEGFQY